MVRTEPTTAAWRARAVFPRLVVAAAMVIGCGAMRAAAAQTPSTDQPTTLPDLARACDPLRTGDAVRARLSKPRDQAGALAPIDELVALAAREPGIAAHHLDLARCYYLADRYDEARQSLDRASILLRTGAALAPPPARPGSLPVAGRDVSRPEKVTDVAPVYRGDAERLGITGIVIIDAVVDRNGRVRQARVAGSIPELDEAALAAVRQWRYRPVTVEDKPVDVAISLLVRFGPPTPRFTDTLDVARHLSLRRDEGAGGWVDIARNLLDNAVANVAGAIRLTEETSMPKPIRTVQPEMPAAAFRPPVTRGKTEVSLECVVGRDGSVSRVRVLSPPARFDQAATAALRQWRFEPGTVNGEPAAVIVQVVMVFEVH